MRSPKRRKSLTQAHNVTIWTIGIISNLLLFILSELIPIFFITDFQFILLRNLSAVRNFFEC